MKSFIAILVNEDCDVSPVADNVVFAWIQETMEGYNMSKTTVSQDNMEHCLEELVKVYGAELINDENENDVYKFSTDLSERLLQDDKDELERQVASMDEEINDLLGQSWQEDCTVVKYSVSLEYSCLFLWIFK